MDPEIQFIPIDDLPVRLAAKYMASFCLGLDGKVANAIAVFPTRSAARSVRMEVLGMLEKSGKFAMGGISFLTPESFLDAFMSGGPPAANAFESEAAWLETFNSLSNADVSEIFPRGKPDSRDFPSLAETFGRLRACLAEIGESISSLAQNSAVSDSFDGAKWRQMGRIESAYLRRLESAGLMPPEDALARVLSDFSESENPLGSVGDIFVFGLCDISPLFERVLRRLADCGARVRICVFADGENFAGHFDSFGRPNSKWDSEPLPLSDSEIHPVQDVSGQAAAVAAALSKYGGRASLLAALACDEPDSLPAMAEALESEGISAYSPEGVPLAEGARAAAVRLLAAYLKAPDMAAFSDFLRNPHVLEFVRERIGLAPAEAMEAFDAFAGRFFPPSLEAARSLARRGSPERSIFELFAEEFDSLFEPGGASASLEDFLSRLFSCGHFERGEPESAREAGFSEFLDTAFSELRAAEESGLHFGSAADVLDALLAEASRLRLPVDKAAEDVAMLDWMEIFWAFQPHLILCDMNEGIVPQGGFGDSFLSDGAREKLGLANSSSRRRRDSYMLWAMLRSRAGRGMVSVVVPRLRGDGAPAQPSCLLLKCGRENLPSRVNLLFGECAPPPASPPFRPSWKLEVPRADLPDWLSPSAFKSYISCPFRFYLEYVLKLEMFDEARRELAPADFGSLLHAAFEFFGGSEFSGATEAEDVERALLAGLKSVFSERYGGRNCASLLFQRESAAELLSAAASAQALHAAQGWRIEQVEADFETEIDGYPVKMRIDRIDRNENGDLMIIDYKTKASVRRSRGMSVPESYHRRGVRAAGGGIDLDWVDLQLPIYLKAVREKFPGADISCAYFILAAEHQMTGIYGWSIDSETMESAARKASDIVAKIRAREFSPSDRPPAFDAWKTFFSFAGGNPAEFLDWGRAEK